MALSDKQIDELRKHADTMSRASSDAANSAVEVWKSRIDMALTVEDEELVKSLVEDGPVVRYMDTNCQCGKR